MRMYFMTFIVSLISFSAYAEVTAEQIESLRRAFKTTSEERIFFHWTKSEVGSRWAKQGHIDQGEVGFYNTPTGDRQAYGPGVYMAESSTSSKGFGEYPVVFIIPKGTAIYDEQIEYKVLGRPLNFTEKIEVAQKLPFIRNVTGDWWLTNSEKVLTRVEYAGRYGAHADEIMLLNDPRKMQEFLSSRRGTPAGDYLESLFHLTYYMDGISLIRALRVAPHDPWSQFEPEHFENFKNLNKKILAEKPNGRRLDSWGEGELDKTAWVKQQVQSELHDLMKELFQAKTMDFRGHGIRAGGSDKDNTFKISPQELVVLLENPYLSVTYSPAEDGKSFYVSYQYPDMERFEKLKPLMTAEFVAEVEKMGLKNILSREDSRVQWNQKLIRHLLTQLFSSLYETNIDAASFLTKFISIHPYSDGNGRVARLYMQKALLPTGRTLPPMFISDLDLLIRPDVLSKVLNSSSNAYGNLNRALGAELMISKMPDYFQLPEISKLMESLETFGLQAEHLPGREYDEKIRHRQFHDIFSEKFGAAWNMNLDSSLLQGLTLARRHGLNGYADAIANKIEMLIKSLKPDDHFHTKMQELRKYKELLIKDPGLSKVLLNIESKLSQTVLKFDASSDKGARAIQQYLLSVPTSLQRSILRQVLQEPSLTDEVKKWWRGLAARTEIESLLKTFAAGKLPQETFLQRLRNLDLLPEDRVSMSHLTEEKLMTVLSKLNFDSQVLLLSKLSLDSWPTTARSFETLRGLADTLIKHAEKGTPEFRAQVAGVFISQSATNGLYGLKLSVEERKKMWQTAVAINPESRYRLVDYYNSMAEDAKESWAQAELAEILKAEMVKTSPHPAAAQALRYLAWEGHLEIPGTEEQIKKILAIMDPYIQERLFSTMPIRHFKKPFYEANLSFVQDLIKSDYDKISLKRKIYSLWDKWLGEIQDAPLKEAWLKRLWQEAPLIGFSVSERTEMAANMLAPYPHRHMAFAKELRTFALNRLAVHFNAKKSVAEIPYELQTLLGQDSGVWDLMNDKMLGLFLSSDEYLRKLLTNEAFLKSPSRLNLLIQTARKVGVDDVDEKVFHKIAGPIDNERRQPQAWEIQILMTLAENEPRSLKSLWELVAKSAEQRSLVSQTFADRLSRDLKASNKNSVFVRELEAGNSTLEVLLDAKFGKEIKGKLLIALKTAPQYLEQSFLDGIIERGSFKSDLAQVLRESLDKSNFLLPTGAKKTTGAFFAGVDPATWAANKFARYAVVLIQGGVTNLQIKEALAEFYYFLRPKERTLILENFLTHLAAPQSFSASDNAKLEVLRNMAQSLKAGDLSVLPKVKPASRATGMMCKEIFLR